MNRRQFLAGLAASLPLAALGEAASIDLRLGVQLWMLRDELQKDFTGTLKKVAEIGLKRVELVDITVRPAAEIKSALAASRLECVSAHVSLAEFDADIVGILDRARQIGIRTLVVPRPWLPPAQQERMKNGQYRQVMNEEITLDHWKLTASLLNIQGEKLRQAGMQLAFHNHNFEFRKFGDVVPYEMLAAATDPRLVKLQLDVGWLVSAGLDPVTFLKRWPQRFASLHLKDVQAGFTPNVTLDTVPIEIGKGVVKWGEILPLAYQTGIREYYIEQEGPYLRPPLESLRLSYKYLNDLAFRLQ